MKKLIGLILLVVILFLVFNPAQAAIIYQVRTGDSLWKIAQMYNTTVEKLVELNNLKNYQLYIGQKLIISKYNSGNNTEWKYKGLNRSYRVRSNETLEEIAEYFKVSETTLRVLNNLRYNEDVYTGQQLSMPFSPAFSNKHEIYTVRTNNLPVHEIAYQKGVSIRAILQANYMRDINAKFKAGTTLIIPLDQGSKAVWIDYKDGKPVNSLFSY